jgi:hypothetical protein
MDYVKKEQLFILNKFKEREDGWIMVEILWNGLHLNLIKDGIFHLQNTKFQLMM